MLDRDWTMMPDLGGGYFYARQADKRTSIVVSEEGGRWGWSALDLATTTLTGERGFGTDGDAKTAALLWWEERNGNSVHDGGGGTEVGGVFKNVSGKGGNGNAGAEFVA